MLLFFLRRSSSEGISSWLYEKHTLSIKKRSTMVLIESEPSGRDETGS